MTVKIELYFDGNVVKHGTEDAKGSGSYLLIDKETGREKRETFVLGNVTNNEAEYQGLLRGLEQTRETARSRIDLVIYGDSKLVINQINKTWSTKKPQLRVYRDKTLDLLSNFQSWKAIWVPREKNRCT